MTIKARLFRGLTALLAILLCFSLLMTNLLIEWSGQVNIFLNVTVPTLPMEGDSILYTSGVWPGRGWPDRYAGRLRPP